MVNRREFLENMILTSIGLSVGSFGYAKNLKIPLSNARVNQSEKTLVFIFLRGACDVLSYLIPYTDKSYYKLRPTLNLTEEKVRQTVLNDKLALHPEAKFLKKLFDQKQVSFIMHTGLNHLTRSHFDAQDFIESGTPGVKSTEDGFLNRALIELYTKNQSKKLSLKAEEELIRSLSIQKGIPRSVRGSFSNLSLTSLKNFKFENLSALPQAAESFEELYSAATNEYFKTASHSAYQYMKKIRDMQKSRENIFEKYPNENFSKSLADIATVIKSNVGLRLAVTEMNGWDTHNNQGVEDNGVFAKNIKILNESLESFIQDLDSDFSKTTIVLISEFGRTVAENGSKGTDHGHGSAMTIIDSDIKKQVLNSWQDLAVDNLYEKRDLNIITDYRLVMAEIFKHTYGIQNFDHIFPEFENNTKITKSFLNIWN